MVAGSTPAQWLFWVRNSLFTQFFRLSGIRPKNRDGAKEEGREREKYEVLK